MSDLPQNANSNHDDSNCFGRSLPLKWDTQRQQFFRRKYGFDIVAGWILLFFFSPIILLLWLLVKLTSPGTGFYQQSRLGLNRVKFNVYKLRSMINTAEKDGEAIWCVKGDDRVTWLGKILRKLHLDELPQLLNVARGEMSLIGPRPERPDIINSEELDTKIDDYYDRIKVKPGITGMAQINLPPDEKLSGVMKKQILDIHYINETTFWLEVRILIATALRMAGLKGVRVMNLLRLCRLPFLKKIEDEQFLDSDLENATPSTQDAYADNNTLAFAMATDSKSISEPLSDEDSQESSSDIRLPR